MTATKRETPLLYTPMSVAVLDATQLRESGAVNLEDYWRMVPSLAYSDQGFAGSAIAIRGLGNDFNSNVEAMAAVYLDDIPLTASDGLFTSSPDLELVDVHRVEVLRGPQGTLFGASAMGGAVRTISQAPDPSATAGWVESAVSVISHGGESLEASAMLNRPLGEQSAVRLVAHYRDRDGFIDDVLLGLDDVNDLEVAGLRLALATPVGATARLTARVIHQDTEGGASNAVMTSGIPALGIRTDGDYEVARRVEDRRDQHFTLASLTLEGERNWGSWTAISAWHEHEVDLTLDVSNLVEYFTAGASPVRYTQEVFSQEFRVASPADHRFQWLAGLFYLDQDTPRRDQIVAPDLPDILPLPPDFPDVIFDVQQDATRRDLGVFGEIGWPLTDSITATVGARWFDMEKHSRSTTTALLQGIFGRVTDLAYEESGVTPKVTLSWNRDDTQVYAAAARGFRAGGGNAPFAVAICGAPESYDSDDLWNYELGFKRVWPERGMRLNLAAYAIDWSDAQQKIRRPDCRNISIENVGEVRSSGLELEWSKQVGDHWSLQAALGFNRSELDEDAPQAPRGTDIPLVPDVTASVASNHRFQLLGRTARLRVDVQYTGDSETNLDQSLNVGQSGYTLVHLRLTTQGETWSASLFANNLLNKQGAFATALPTPLGAGAGFVTARPRTVGVRVRYGFD